MCVTASYGDAPAGYAMIGLILAAVLSGVRIDAPNPVCRIVHKDGARGAKDTTVARGDWQGATTLLMVYEPLWAATLADFLHHVTIPVRLLLHGAALSEAQQFIERERLTASVKVWPLWVDSPWVRDFGPQLQIAVDGTIRWRDARYHAARPADDTLPQRLATYLQRPVVALSATLEGGALTANGGGLCALSWSSFIAAGQKLDDEVSLSTFMTELGCRFLALVPALTQELTGHIDMFAQFLGPDTVAVASLEPMGLHADDALLLDAAAEALHKLGEAADFPLHVVRIPMSIGPDGTYYSYLNGVRLGSQYFVPSYFGVAPETEKLAYQAFAEAMPQLHFVPVVADAWIALGGAAHCVTLALDLVE